MSAEIATLHVPFLQHVKAMHSQVRIVRARSDMASTITRGWPDMTLLCAGKAPLFIEFKDKGTPITKHQKECHADLASVGMPVHILRDLGLAISLVREWASGAPVRHAATSTAPIVTKLWMGKLRSFRQEANGTLTLINGEGNR